MKRIAFIALVFLLGPTLLLAQYRYDGRRVWPSTIGGKQFVEPTRQMWFPAAADSGSTSGVLNGTAGWVLDTSNPPNVVWSGSAGTGQIQAFGFDADGGSTGDDIAYLTFVCPEDYKTDSMELYLYWYHLDNDGAATDSVAWDGTVQAVGSGEDLFAAGTGMTVVYTICSQSDSALYITNLDPEVETIAAGDLITIKLFCDESTSQLDSGERAYLIGVLVEYEAKEE